jgi:hypothetical protein
VEDAVTTPASASASLDHPEAMLERYRDLPWRARSRWST